MELHDGQNPEGFEVPGRGEFHDDGRCRALPGLQQGQRDVGIRYFFSPVEGLSHEIKMDDARLQGQRDVRIRYFSPVKGLSHEIKVDASRPYLAFSRDSEMLGSGIFLL